MNRAQRRAALRAGASPDLVTVAGEVDQCPDCASEAELTRDPLGIWHLVIAHDDTCPWLAARQEGTAR